MNLEIIEYYQTNEQEYWKNEIGKSDWQAGKYLCQLLEENKLRNLKYLYQQMQLDYMKIMDFCIQIKI